MKAFNEVTIPVALFEILISGFDLNERQRRGVYGLIASAAGYGGVSTVVRNLGAAAETVRRGHEEFVTHKSLLEKQKDSSASSSAVAPSEPVVEPPTDNNEKPLSKGKIRRVGGGRKSIAAKNPEILIAIANLMEQHEYGDPMHVLKWTTLSLRDIRDEIIKRGYIGRISAPTIGAIIEELGYSKQANQKMLQVSKPHPDRDKQFCFINDKAAQFMRENYPVISVDCKKKENVGNYKNAGQEYRPKKNPRLVLDHDFAGKLGKVAPYGIYVLNNNTGFVNLGVSRDTAEFAGESIGRWLHYIGMPTFPQMKKIYIVCDGGGSNGSRPKLWKWVLAQIADLYHIDIHVSHFPPGTSKWNKVEHRLFSYITKSWQGQPLIDIETVISLIESTTTERGLTVSCKLDENVYDKGVQISDEMFDSIDIERLGDMPEWNYIIRGFKAEKS